MKTNALGALALSTLLLSSCGDETGSDRGPAEAPKPPVEAPLSDPAERNPVGLTPAELAAEPPPAVVAEPQTVPAADESATAQEVTELDWNALIPPDWQPDKLLEDFNADELADDDPRALELMDRLAALWSKAPVVPELDGRRVKIPGFVVPLETDGAATSEFLLVPYYGACIHVPPPPANQTVHVLDPRGSQHQGGLFDPVWVTGTLRVESYSGELADAGYRIDATSVEPYE